MDSVFTSMTTLRTVAATMLVVVNHQAYSTSLSTTSTAVTDISSSSTSSSSTSSTTNSSSGDHLSGGPLSMIELIGIGVGGLAFIIFFVIIIVVIIIKRRRRKSHQPPILPKLTPSGLICPVEANPEPPRIRYQPWQTGGSSQQGSTDEEDVKEKPDDNYNDHLDLHNNHHHKNTAHTNPLFHATAQDPDDEYMNNNDRVEYLNMMSDLASPQSIDSGSYILCLSTRPDSMPTTLAPGFDGKFPKSPRAIEVLDPLYMPMNTSPDRVRQEEEKEEEKGEGEELYTTPDQLPPPWCGLGSRPYVNVHEGVDQQSGEQGDIDSGQYQNLSSMGYVYDNIPQLVTTPKTSTSTEVIRSESLKNMASPAEVVDTLSGCLALQKLSLAQDRVQVNSPTYSSSCPPFSCLFSSPHKEGKGGRKSSGKSGCVGLQKSSSMSQVASSKPAPRVVHKHLERSIPEHRSHPTLHNVDQQYSDSDSDSEGNYKNLQKKNADYMNVPEKKPEPKAEIQNHSWSDGVGTSAPAASDNLGIRPTKIPVTEKKAPKHVTGERQYGSASPKTGNSKPVIGGAKPENDSTKPVFGSTTPAFGSSKLGTNTPKPATGNTKPAPSRPKPVAVGIKPAAAGNKQPASGEGAASHQQATCATSSDSSNHKQKAKAGVGKGEKQDDNRGQHSAELMKILAKRRQNNGES